MTYFLEKLPAWVLLIGFILFVFHATTGMWLVLVFVVWPTAMVLLGAYLAFTALVTFNVGILLLGAVFMGLFGSFLWHTIGHTLGPNRDVK
jgi:hypothetical protein